MKNLPWSVLRFKGTGSWNNITLSATAVVDGWLGTGEKKVKLTCAANHNLTAGSAITIKGTDNYDGTWETVSGTATTLLYIPARYVAETTATADTCKFTLAPGHAFEFGGFRLTLGAQADQEENMTITMDAGAGSVYDCLPFSYSTNGVQQLIWQPPITLIKNGAPVATYTGGFQPMQFDKDDELDFAWANAGTETYGLEVFWRKI